MKLSNMINIHLIRSASIADEFYDEVVCLLNQFPGPMKFHTDDQHIRFLDSEVQERFVSEDEFYDKSISALEKARMMECQMDSMARHIYEPEHLKEVAWDSIFEKCREYRKKKKLKQEDAVILLTDIRNTPNWFSAGDTNGANNFFVHTEDWQYYTYADPRFPVAYLVASIMLKKKMFGSYTELAEHIHNDPRGCISDFCQDKREITLQLRTADICDDCISIIKKKKIEPDLFIQSTQIMEHIRSQLLFRDRYELTQRPSRVVITPGREPIRFMDMGNSQLRLSPLEKAIFILFLENPSGISFNRMSEHRDRLKQIYMTIGHNLTLANLTNTLDYMTNPTENRLSETVSKMRTKFSKHVGYEMAEHYSIDGPNGARKKIKLDRSLVIWDGIEPKAE
jgi:hypothetical protein